jgi:predicted peptidase
LTTSDVIQNVLHFVANSNELKSINSIFMKPTVNGIIAVVCVICMNACSKENVTTPKVSASEESLSTTNIVGRQQVITLNTGDHYYPTSQALLWLPTDYTEKRERGYPLLISLGGRGQNGSSDIHILLNSETVAKRIADGWNAEAVNPVNGINYRFIVFSPTKDESNSWGWSASAIKIMLSELKQKYNINNRRVYITGLSAGGWGLWSCITDDTSLCKQFAAIGPVSSAGSDHPDKITNIDKYGIACWNICGTADSFFGLAVNYTKIINTNKPPISATLTPLEGVGHSAWVQAYDPTWTQNGINFYQWLLQYKRNDIAS